MNAPPAAGSLSILVLPPTSLFTSRPSTSKLSVKRKCFCGVSSSDLPSWKRYRSRRASLHRRTYSVAGSMTREHRTAVAKKTGLHALQRSCRVDFRTGDHVDRLSSLVDRPVVVASFLQDLFDLVLAICGHSLRKVRQISDEAPSSSAGPRGS